MENKKIPVTVLTGFLGSGKTTLLNRILSENHGNKIAVIENEFGEIGVDNELVIGADEEIFEMNNGCICCTVRGDLIRILGQLVKRKDRLDYIIVETTGLANPAPVAQTFWVDDEMKEQFSLDAIITIVDAKHVWQHVDSSSQCMEQIAFADVILLNKIDLVSDEELKKLEQKVRTINSQVKIYQTKDAAIGMDKILNVHAFDLDKKIEVSPTFAVEEVPFEYAGIFNLNEFEYSVILEEGPDPSIDLTLIKVNSAEESEIEKAKKSAIKIFSEGTNTLRPGKFLKSNNTLNSLLLPEKEQSFRLKVSKPGFYILFTQHHPDEFNIRFVQNDQITEALISSEYEHSHEHDAEVGSIGIEDYGALDLKKLDKWLNWLIQSRGTDIFRMKGILNIKDNDERFIFQGVHMLFDAKADRKWHHDEIRKNQVVFIGKNLDREELMKGFRACIAEKAAVAY
jgi:G3E family GTPase